MAKLSIKKYKHTHLSTPMTTMIKKKTKCIRFDLYTSIRKDNEIAKGITPTINKKKIKETRLITRTS